MPSWLTTDSNDFVFIGPVSGLSSSDGVIFIIVLKTLFQCQDHNSAFLPVLDAPPDVTQVACGRLHVLLLTEDGHVFSRGLGAQCGLGVNAAGATVFTQIPDLSNIFHISAGDLHSAALQYSKERYVNRYLEKWPKISRWIILYRAAMLLFPCTKLFFSSIPTSLS